MLSIEQSVVCRHSVCPDLTLYDPGEGPNPPTPSLGSQRVKIISLIQQNIQYMNMISNIIVILFCGIAITPDDIHLGALRMW